MSNERDFSEDICKKCGEFFFHCTCSQSPSPSLPETEREPSFYCVKPSDIPCHKQCDSCKKVSPADQPVPEEVMDADKEKAFIELVRDMRPEQALRVAAYIDQEILSLQTRLSSTEAERDAIKQAFDLQAEELKKLRHQ